MNDLGHGGGIIVSILAFYSDKPSSNPTGCQFSDFNEKPKINKKVAGDGPLKDND